MLKRTLQALSWLFSLLPPSAARAVGRFLGWIYGSVIRYHRRDARQALAVSLPDVSAPERAAILRRMYAHLGMNVVEITRLPHLSEPELATLIDWEDEHHAHEVLAAGKGLLVLSAHMGNWDLLCTLAPRFNYPTTIITKRIKNKGLNDYWMATRARFGLKFVPAHNSYRQCLSALRKNEIVGFILDQNMINTEGIFVDFFGRPACTTPGLAYMSAQSGAAVVPVFMLRQADGRHRLKVLPAIAPPPDRKPETIHAYTQRYTKVIEDVIRQNPDQWIWLHRRWRTKPPPAEQA
jgi:KDO2-lipid IV(A) lauroyltransferase